MGDDMHATVEFDQPPSAIAYHLRAFIPSAGLTQARGFPPLRARWRKVRLPPGHLSEFLALTGLRADQDWQVLFPHVFGFRLQMVILTHPAFPLSIWRALQIRNHFVLHRPLPLDAGVELETRVAGERTLDKGAEVDLHTTLRLGKELLWEGLSTFYYRGRFGRPGTPSRHTKAPEAHGDVVAEWTAASGGGRRFGALTGDYNGIHTWRWYARMFGFPRALLHPQRVLGQCLAHLPGPRPHQTQRLETWLKGPVHYGSHVSLRSSGDEKAQVFAVHTDGDQRPAIVGRWSSSSEPAAALLAPDDG